MADQEEQARKMMEDQAKKMGSVVAKCWSDDSFKKKLLADPAATLKAEGVKIDLPAGMTLKAVEDTDKVCHIIIPPKPTELSDEQLEMAAGGKPDFTMNWCLCTPSCNSPQPPSCVTACGSAYSAGCGCATIVIGGCGCAARG